MTALTILHVTVKVHYTPDARMYCSSSEDGSIKVKRESKKRGAVDIPLIQHHVLTHTHTHR